MAEEFRVLRPYEFHCQLISKGHRADGRTLEEVREVRLETDAIRTADSSSLVKLGNTSLVCGCTTQLLRTQDNGDNEEIKIRIELPPICSSPTGHRTQNTAQLLTKMLKNILNDTNCLDRQSLYISGTDYYWSVDVEVICLNYDGCLLDAALIAVLSALKSLKLTCKSKDIPERRFEINSMPICSSFAVIGDHFICDPNLEEETVAQSTYSITVNPSAKSNLHVNKIGGRSISTNKLFKCIELAEQRAAKLRKIVDGTSADDEAKIDCTYGYTN